eukprot:CAMPEP_0170183778 /NCGR_PEP_ID=MMETSP0040_2-20121228/31697_1 /TAXON_ID=641309 /ORGANISM="Lotharella oceanica, Strain CCMP622" /LENGTH=203 /DNA_ID=CAMNT_0010429625 /DNA_START=116 /DNA_END=727 /DNA_ORIENTATION=-
MFTRSASQSSELDAEKEWDNVEQESLTDMLPKMGFDKPDSRHPAISFSSSGSKISAFSTDPWSEVFANTCEELYDDPVKDKDWDYQGIMAHWKRYMPRNAKAKQRKRRGKEKGQEDEEDDLHLHRDYLPPHVGFTATGNPILDSVNRKLQGRIMDSKYTPDSLPWKSTITARGTRRDKMGKISSGSGILADNKNPFHSDLEMD